MIKIFIILLVGIPLGIILWRIALATWNVHVHYHQEEKKIKEDLK